jgi:hypothetical protein
MLTARETIDLYAVIADMKDVDYRNTLAITTLVDLLVEKGLITRDEISGRARQLDAIGE